MDTNAKKPGKNSSSTRIFAYLAQEAPVAVILRRGPSRQVCLIKWDLKTDKLEVGQWFKGRIYERRCDLSPDGELFLYFAAKHKLPLPSWTALSHPPYLTAITLWNNLGTWGGGGIFEGNSAIMLNHYKHGENNTGPPPETGFTLPNRMRTRPFGENSGRGEDFPIYHSLLEKYGWTLLDEGEHGEFSWKDSVRWRYKKPMLYEKQSRAKKYCLQMQIKGIGQTNDAWYWIDYVVTKDGESLLQLPHTDWADWDHKGDLLFARDEKLFRAPAGSLAKVGGDSTVINEIADLNGLKFEAKPPPAPKESKYAKKRRERKKK